MESPTATSLTTATVLTLGAVVAALAACAGTGSGTPQARVDSLQAELAKVAAERAMVATHLTRFDSLDFDVFSNQKWDRLAESHANDIVVTWPDGHGTNGITRHIEDLKGMFVSAPDTKIISHPIKICSGDWTAVTGVMTGTFSRPMPTADGKTIAPTGKPVRLTMATIAHWKGSTMDHEWLFWDGQDFMKQLGLTK